MKNKILLGAMLFMACTFAMHANAQLEVQTSGDVKVSKKLAVNGMDISDTVALGVKLPATQSSRNYGIYSYGKFVSASQYIEGCKVAVVGQLYNAPLFLSEGNESPRPSGCGLYAGVAGVSNIGIGVYGATATSLPTLRPCGSYAGYFSGNVNVTGTLTATTITQTSDARFKENVSNLNNKSSVLSQLRPVSYTLRKDNVLFMPEEEKHVTHYGFIAQEVQEIAPELVYEDGAGYLSINYTELIPLLVKKVQELSAEVEELQKQQTK